MENVETQRLLLNSPILMFFAKVETRLGKKAN